MELLVELLVNYIVSRATGKCGVSRVTGIFGVVSRVAGKFGVVSRVRGKF